MDQDRVAGTGKQIKGELKEAAGKFLRNTKLEAAGKADQAAGKAQNLEGSLREMQKP
jgi:uncharacterized protein YjbJ (UPF0337 family)